MAMVEMVFVLPILLLLVFAIAEFGLMFSRWLTLSNAVREGARTGVVFRSPCNNGVVTTEVENAIASYAAAGGIPTSDLTITVTGMCDRVDDPADPNDAKLVVDASFDFKLHIPFSDSLGGSIPLAYQSTMRNE